MSEELTPEMSQFYEAYKDDEFVTPLVTQN